MGGWLCIYDVRHCHGFWGVKLKLRGLQARAFTPQAILLALSFFNNPIKY